MEITGYLVEKKLENLSALIPCLGDDFSEADGLYTIADSTGRIMAHSSHGVFGCLLYYKRREVGRKVRIKGLFRPDLKKIFEHEFKMDENN